jgi:cation transport ATPase
MKREFIRIGILWAFLSIFAFPEIDVALASNPALVSNAVQKEGNKSSHVEDAKPSKENLEKIKESPEKKTAQAVAIIIGIVGTLTFIGILAWAYNISQKGREYGLKFVFSINFALLFVNFILLFACVALKQLEIGILTYIVIWLFVFWRNAKKSNYIFSLQYTLVQAIAAIIAIVLFIGIMNDDSKKRKFKGTRLLKS